VADEFMRTAEVLAAAVLQGLRGCRGVCPKPRSFCAFVVTQQGTLAANTPVETKASSAIARVAAGCWLLAAGCWLLAAHRKTSST